MSAFRCAEHTPVFTVKYCTLHAPRACAGILMKESDLGLEHLEPTENSYEGVLQFITSKNVTRNQVYYQVTETIHQQLV